MFSPQNVEKLSKFFNSPGLKTQRLALEWKANRKKEFVKGTAGLSRWQPVWTLFSEGSLSKTTKLFASVVP